MGTPETRLADLIATVAANRWIPLKPTARQARFLTEERFEVLYGGAAGGGKSVAALMSAAQYLTQPGYAALILRRTYPQLSQPGGLIPVSHEWWANTAARWNGTEKQWTFPSGATVTFGHMQYEHDKYNYQSGEYALVSFEELTQFTQSQYEYLFSRVRRRHDVPFPVRVRSTSNPGGTGHRWVKSRFIDAITPERGFIPAQLDDNPHLDREAYEASLAVLDPVTRKQLREGDWHTSAGQYVFENVTTEAIADDLIATFERPLRGVDYGYFPDPWVYECCAYLPGVRELYIFDEATATRASNDHTANLLRGKLTWPDREGDEPKVHRELIWCDSAEPKSIADYRDIGLDARPVRKFRGSVEASVKWLQSLNRIVIDPARCPVAASEFTAYEYEQSRDGTFDARPPDRDNHAIDAVRYAVSQEALRRHAQGGGM